MYLYREPSAVLEAGVEDTLSWGQDQGCLRRTWRRESSGTVPASVPGGGDNQAVTRASECFLGGDGRKGFQGGGTAITNARRCERHGRARERQGLKTWNTSR